MENNCFKLIIVYSDSIGIVDVLNVLDLLKKSINQYFHQKYKISKRKINNAIRITEIGHGSIDISLFLNIVGVTFSILSFLADIYFQFKQLSTEKKFLRIIDNLYIKDNKLIIRIKNGKTKKINLDKLKK